MTSGERLMAKYRLLADCYLDGHKHKAGDVIERSHDWKGPTRSMRIAPRKGDDGRQGEGRRGTRLVPRFSTIPAKHAHCAAITCSMRGDHFEAILGLGHDPYRELVQAFNETPHPTAWLIDGELAALGGIAGPPLLCPIGVAWLVVAEHAVRFSRALVKELRHQLELCGGFIPHSSRRSVRPTKNPFALPRSSASPLSTRTRKTDCSSSCTAKSKNHM